MDKEDASLETSASKQTEEKSAGGEECDVCGQNHSTEECPELGLSSQRFTPQISRARLTAPHYLNPVEFTDGTIGVVAVETISNKTQLGPFEAKKTMHNIERDDLFVLKILSKDGSYISLDASSEDHCNWMALVQVAQTEEEQNCMAYQLGINIYFNTTQDIQVGDQLKVWYAPQYAKKLKKSLVPDGRTKSMLGETLVTEPYSEEEAEETLETENEEKDESQETEEDLSNLERPVDDVEGDFTCKQCSQKFTSQFLFAKHIREHLFPIYNYTEGPPRRGRRPVPLKVTERSGSLSTPSRGRGTGRKRGRPRGSGRGTRSDRRPGRPPKAKYEREEEENEDNEEPVVKRACIDDDDDDRDDDESMSELEKKDLNKEQEANKNHLNLTDAETKGQGGDMTTKSNEVSNTPLRRSARALKGLGRLGRLFRYPGEETIEEGDAKSTDEGEQVRTRKRFGIAMAASLRKAAMDEMTSPAVKRSARSLLAMKPPKMTSPVKKMTPVLHSNKTVTESSEVKSKVKVVDRQPAKEEIPSSQSAVDTESPKKYIVITQGDKSTTYEIPASFQVKSAPILAQKSGSTQQSEISKKEEDQKDDGEKQESRVKAENKSMSPIKLSTKETSPHIGSSNTSQDSKVVGTSSTSQESEVVGTSNTSQESEVVGTSNTSQESEVVGTSQDSEVVGTSQESEVVGTSQESEVVGTSQESEVVGTSQESEVVGTSQESEVVGTSQESEVVGTSQESEVVGTSQESLSHKSNQEVNKLKVEMVKELTMDKEGVFAKKLTTESDVTKEVVSDKEEVVTTEVDRSEDVVVGTREEVVEVRTHERKNTIADLDGTDALTALVNAAISADKVPDPIAMVAADLYDDRSLEVAEEEDVEEYRAPRKAYTTEVYLSSDGKDGDQSQAPKQKRKKRRRGDDPELETLESMTKVVEGPNGTEEFVCGVCNKHFTMLKYLKLHLPAHTDRYRCKICGKRFARNESLLKHTCDDTASLVEQVIDDEGSEMFTCRECGRSFSQLSFATRHASMHRTRFTCTKCGRTFLREDLLEEHDCSGGQLEEGEVTERHECQICKQSFTNGKYLFRHMAMHTDIYKCEVCGKCYSRKDSLQRHISRCCPELSQEYSVHVCPNCKKTFGTSLGLQNHQINCGKYQCGSCKVAYFSIKDLTEHDCAGKVLNEKASVQFPCKECNKTFASIAYLVRHEASHHDAFKCNLCEKVFIRKEELNWHTPVCMTRQKILEDGHAPCEVCGEEFNEWLAFKEHHMSHTHPHKCEKCSKRFIKIGTLHNHKCEGITEGTPGVSKPNLLSCEICHKTFKNERYLTRHVTLHGQPEHRCEFCNKSFTRKDYLNDHQCRMPDGTTVRMVRKKNRIYIRDNMACSQCGKTFSSRSNMMKHMKVHGEKQAECHICHKKFHYENYLKLHIATVHEKQYQLQCKHCGKVLYSKTGLIAHIKQFHAETIKLYPCPKCGKTFRQKGNMKTHLISHTKERAFKCDVCSKAFKYPDQLNRHRLEHTLTQKFSCEMCDKQFVRSYELRNHIRNYHSGFVYVCGVCHECCAHRHTIIRHYKRKHPEVGNVFEEKPEFLDSLQKPVTAATQSRMMVDGDDIKPSILRVGPSGGHREVIITAEGDGATHGAFGSGEVILQGAADLLGTGEHQHVMEGQENTVFILKVVNQEDGEGIQEMELTEDTKAHLAQLLQAHGSGQDAITHIQVGDQTLQVHREEVTSHNTDDTNQMEFIQEIKFDPQQLEVLQSGEVMANKSQSEVSSNLTLGQELLTTAGPTGGLAPSTSIGEVVSLEGQEVLQGHDSSSVQVEGVQVVEMDDGRLGRILQMEDGQQMLHMGQVIQMDGSQVIELDESQLLAMDATDGVTSAASTSQSVLVSSALDTSVLSSVLQSGVKVTKRHNSQGEIVVEVEGQSGQSMGEQVLHVLDTVVTSEGQEGIESAAVEDMTDDIEEPTKGSTGRREGEISQLELQLTQGTVRSDTLAQGDTGKP